MLSEKHGYYDKVSYRTDEASFINFGIEGLGIFYKYWITTDTFRQYSYDYAFYTKYEMTKPIAESNIANKKIKRICNNFLPFMLSRGKDKDTIPLLMKDSLELAKYAITFDPAEIPL